MLCREIIFYDSLSAIIQCAPTKMVLNGGSLISRVCSRIPQFSWDIDLAKMHKRGWKLEMGFDHELQTMIG
jgi:hypothetical protein